MLADNPVHSRADSRLIVDIKGKRDGHASAVHILNDRSPGASRGLIDNHSAFFRQHIRSGPSDAAAPSGKEDDFRFMSHSHVFFPEFPGTCNLRNNPRMQLRPGHKLSEYALK